jgi:hypothetical protein
MRTPLIAAAGLDCRCRAAADAAGQALAEGAVIVATDATRKSAAC